MQSSSSFHLPEDGITLGIKSSWEGESLPLFKKFTQNKRKGEMGVTYES